MRAIVSGANVVMFFVFVAFAAVQYNDPDPYWWMPMYGRRRSRASSPGGRSRCAASRRSSPSSRSCGPGSSRRT
jgi:hypothetical protein